MDRQERGVASAVLRKLLLWLAQLHMVQALLVLVLDSSPYVPWACGDKRGPLCFPSHSVWNLQKTFPEAISYTVQAFLVVTASLTFASVVVAASREYKDVAAILNAVTFAVGILPWSLALGFESQSKGRISIGVWICVAATVLHLLAASFSLVAIYVPDAWFGLGSTSNNAAVANDELEDAKTSLLGSFFDPPKKKKDFTSALNAFSAVAVFAGLASLVQLRDKATGKNADSTEFQGAVGCQTAAFLLALDVAVVCASVTAKSILPRTGAIVTASISLIGWIVGIVGCSLSAVASGTFDGPAIFSLVSFLASVCVFGLSLYTATHDR